MHENDVTGSTGNTSLLYFGYIAKSITRQPVKIKIKKKSQQIQALPNRHQDLSTFQQ